MSLPRGTSSSGGSWSFGVLELDTCSDSISQRSLAEALPVDTAVALKLHDDLLAAQPEGARHDSDICPFCVEKAQATTSDPSRSGGPDVSKSNLNTEGGDNPTMSDISQAAHEALLKKAVEDAVAEATKTTEAALLTKTNAADAAEAKVKELETELATHKGDNERLNKDLDAAQVKLTSATEEVATLKKEATEAVEAAQLAEVAAKRGEQVKNLKLFPEEYVTTERASKWASFDEAAWGEQLEEWKQLKPATAGEANSDAASAMTGSSENLTKEKQDAAAAGDGAKKTKPQRAVLGLA